MGSTVGIRGYQAQKAAVQCYVVQQSRKLLKAGLPNEEPTERSTPQAKHFPNETLHDSFVREVVRAKELTKAPGRPVDCRWSIVDCLCWSEGITY